MKQLLLFYAILASTIVHSQYIPMLQEGNAWSIDTYYCPFDPGNPPMNWIITEQVTIDPIPVDINGISYKQVLLDGELSCLLREEDGVVYKYFNNEEKVLFDMSMEIGEEYSIVSSAFAGEACAGRQASTNIFVLEVMEIRTEFLAGMDRKIIVLTDKFSPGNEDMLWIEGIGTSAGLASPWEEIDFTCGSELACFDTNGVNYFMNDATSCDNTTLSLLDVSEEEIVLYPNPVVRKSILQLPQEGYADTIRILDLHGRVINVLEQTSDPIVIDAMQYKSGRYFVQIVLQNKVVSLVSFIIR